MTARFRIPAALIALLALAGPAAASEAPAPAPAAAPAVPAMHPRFPLRDAAGVNVLASGGPVSPLATCGSCHDTVYIAAHSDHADAGAAALAGAGGTVGARPWDRGPGFFGRWNPLLYDVLLPAGNPRDPAAVADWTAAVGFRHVGGGPAEGLEEMNCFVCHVPSPDNRARTGSLREGRFAWAATATLAGTGLVAPAGEGWSYLRSGFDAEGNVKPERLPIRDPEDENCGQCHGQVDRDPNRPVVAVAGGPADWSTLTTGQVFSPQRISRSGMNLPGKETLTRSWDVHAERLVGCTDCHVSPNNPVYYREPESSRPAHLAFDARRMDFGEYLRRPDHRFGRGTSPGAFGDPATARSGAMRGCESCHDAGAAHPWLPYRDRHLAELSCEACHVPVLYGPAAQDLDWTLPTPAGEPRLTRRGTPGDGGDPAVLTEGYRPVLLPRPGAGGERKLAPYNLVTSWYWVSGDPERPVPRETLVAAFLAGGRYRPEIVTGLDRDGDGELSPGERIPDTPNRIAVLRSRLEAVGVVRPAIRGEIQPYPVHHDVTGGSFAIRDCGTCHREESRLAEPFLLAGAVPGGVVPRPVGGGPDFPGSITEDASGRLYFTPRTSRAGLYVLGHDGVRWANLLGLGAVLAVALGIGVHGGLRWRALRRAPRPHRKRRKVYLYSGYERMWHWLQALGILALVLTGLEIHFPGAVPFLGFAAAVRAHNILAVVLIVNAVFAAFFHLASGEIRHFLPEPRGFFAQTIEQTRYYLGGIFRHEPHPFSRNRRRKLNPLQQVTYLAILNVLLPLQIVTGVAMWGAQHRPDLAARLGGLTFLAPVHAMGAWLFVAFLIMHIYLTTTGHTPAANLKAMVVGWDEVDVPGRPGAPVAVPVPAGDGKESAHG